MVSIRFTSFVLGLMFIFLAVRDSVANTQQAMEKMVLANGNGFAAAGGTPLIVKKEIFDGVPAAAEARNGRLGGRKMMVKRAALVKEEGVNIGGASKITGKDMYASKKPLGISQEPMNDQSVRGLLKAKPINSPSMEISGKEPDDLPNTNQFRSQDSKASKKSIPQESDDPLQKLESQKLLEAANEIVNLMNKDYQGSGTTPRHKPPINNDEPLSAEHAIP